MRAGGSLVFCVFGDEALFSALTQSVVGKIINGRTLVARQAEVPQGGGSGTLPFIGAAEKSRMDAVVDAIAGGVLSMLNLDQFTRRGGMIEPRR